jgi:hypothetical protein
MRDQQEEWLELCQRAPVEQDGEKLFQLAHRINERLEAKDNRLRRVDVGSSIPKNKAVFQIAYDEMLLIKRADLLKSRGYEVSSALGNDSAKRILEKREGYRLFIVGHAAPRETREEMVRWVKTNYADTKILVLNSPSTKNLAEADYNVFLIGAEEWLSIVANAA